jgi:hypothetical protein
MTDLCSETTGRVILVVLEEHPLLTPEVEETKTDVELRALPEELRIFFKSFQIYGTIYQILHTDCIPLDGKYLVAGVLKGKSVPFQLL